MSQPSFIETSRDIINLNYVEHVVFSASAAVIYMASGKRVELADTDAAVFIRRYLEWKKYGDAGRPGGGE